MSTSKVRNLSMEVWTNSEYFFKRKPGEWNIIGFLNECNPGTYQKCPGGTVPCYTNFPNLVRRRCIDQPIEIVIFEMKSRDLKSPSY